MSEFSDESFIQDTLRATTDDMLIDDELQISSVADVSCNVKKTGNVFGEGGKSEIKKKKFLLKEVNELQRRTIDLLEQKSVLEDLKRERLADFLGYTRAANLINTYQIAQTILGNPNADLQYFSVGKILLGDKDKIMKETFQKFGEYRNAYRKCSRFMDYMCFKVEQKQKIDSVPTSNRKTLEEYLASYSKLLASSSSVFAEFESFEKCDFIISSEMMLNEKTSVEKFQKKINLLITKIGKAEIAYNKIQCIVSNVIKKDVYDL